jgi:hypothetical protein
LLEAAKNMPAPHSLQPWTYHSLSGLLAVTKMRLMIDPEFRSQATLFNTAAGVVEHEIGDSVLNHSLLGLARGKIFWATCPKWRFPST